jgi:hypothetical protein
MIDGDGSMDVSNDKEIDSSTVWPQALSHYVVKV